MPETPEVVVVGAGVIGSSIAWRLAQAGVGVVLVDRGAPGGEASGAAAGILASQLEAAGDGGLFRLLARSERLHPSFAAEVSESSGLDIGYRVCGALEVALQESESAALEARAAWQSGQDFPVERLSAVHVRALEGALAPKVIQALFFPRAAQLDPRRFCAALFRCAQLAGAKFRSGHVRRLLSSHGRVEGVDLEGERVSATAVVLAAGAWSSLVEGTGLAVSSVYPVRGQLVALRPVTAPLHRVIFGAGGYLVPRADGRVIVGSTMERVGFEKFSTPQGVSTLLARAQRLCPELAQVPMTSAWAGLRPATEDGLPALGPTPLEGLHLAVGHLRNGILLTPVTAALVAAGVQGQPAEVPAEFAARRLFC
jgi:glycine oxidase